ncbi:MAG: hypothetical protein HC888_06875 [Candidatus Competibacteraceae bacterium]|nr:hypothetical protein [Candidatus Competibacteraceae bacterium]
MGGIKTILILHFVSTASISFLGKLPAAFPKRIPDAILDSKELHIEPIDGDNGIQFKPYPDMKLPTWLSDLLTS